MRKYNIACDQLRHMDAQTCQAILNNIVQHLPAFADTRQTQAIFQSIENHYEYCTKTSHSTTHQFLDTISTGISEQG